MIGDIMPSDSARKLFTDTQIDKMVEIYTDLVEGRKESITSKYLEKGNIREEDAITLLSRVTKIVFRKNTTRINNEFITGEPDLYLGKIVLDADETFDTKCSWSRVTFNKAKAKELDKNYRYQGHCYMALTGAKKHTVAFCLVNGTAQMIIDEKRRAAYRMGIIDCESTDNESFIEQCRQIEINHIFDLQAFKDEFGYFDFANDISKWHYDIPMKERLHMISFDRDLEIIAKIYYRIEQCRAWMNANLFGQSIMIAHHDKEHNAVIVQQG